MLGEGWHTVGFWLAHCWFMVGIMLLYGWRFMLDQRVSNEQSNVGPTKYIAVGPTLNQLLGFGWRMVSVLAGVRHALFTLTRLLHYRCSLCNYFCFLRFVHHCCHRLVHYFLLSLLSYL